MARQDLRTHGRQIEALSPSPARRILFLCTHNSARSQMAEGLARALGAEAVSAGVEARGVRPEAVAVMREIGIDISGQESKTYERFIGERFDEVVTVCDEANEVCPIFPGALRRLHWSVADPSARPGDLSAFRAARDQLRAHIRGLLADR